MFLTKSFLLAILLFLLSIENYIVATITTIISRLMTCLKKVIILVSVFIIVNLGGYPESEKVLMCDLLSRNKGGPRWITRL